MNQEECSCLVCQIRHVLVAMPKTDGQSDVNSKGGLKVAKAPLSYEDKEAIKRAILSNIATHDWKMEPRLLAHQACLAIEAINWYGNYGGSEEALSG